MMKSVGSSKKGSGNCYVVLKMLSRRNTERVNRISNTSRSVGLRARRPRSTSLRGPPASSEHNSHMFYDSNDLPCTFRLHSAVPQICLGVESLSFLLTSTALGSEGTIDLCRQKGVTTSAKSNSWTEKLGGITIRSLYVMPTKSVNTRELRTGWNFLSNVLNKGGWERYLSVNVKG